MLTTAACPAASRNRRPSSAMIQQPSQREATGKVFLKWRGKSPLRVGMRCPGKNCSRVENTVSAIGANVSPGNSGLRREPDYWNHNRNVTSSVVLQEVVLHELIPHMVLLFIVFHRRRSEMRSVTLRCVFVTALLLGSGLAISAQESAKHAITFDDMIKLHRISEPQVSRDGKWLAYTVSTPDMEATRGVSNIWVNSTAGGAAMQLTQSGHDSSPVWAPDGKTLASLSSRAAESHIYLLSMEGGR